MSCDVYVPQDGEGRQNVADEGFDVMYGQAMHGVQSGFEAGVCPQISPIFAD
jgi:hypothetical protein